MGTYNILHLSDLHIGEKTNDNDLETWVHNLCKTLKGEKIHTVIFTGDIFDISSEENDSRNKNGSVKDTVKNIPLSLNIRNAAKSRVLTSDVKNMTKNNGQKKELIKKAVYFFSELLKCLKSTNPELEKENFWFVPGNHDLYRSEDNNMWHLYDGFLKNFYGYPPNPTGDDEYNKEHMVIYPDLVNKKLFLGFNSNVDETDNKRFAAHISNKQLQIVDKYIEEHLEYLDYDIIAFFHHPCNFFEERERSDVDGIINNSSEVNKRLVKWNVKYVLHGHKHWSRVTICRPLAGQKMYMFAAGAIGKLRDKCSGNIIKIAQDKDEIHLKEIKSENSKEFTIAPLDIHDNYMERLLLDAIGCQDEKSNSDEKEILKMIDKLYLSHKQSYYLQYNQSNLSFLRNGIKYNLGFGSNALDDLSEKEKAIWDDVTKILENWEIPKNVKDKLQMDSLEKQHVAFALLGGFFTDLYNEIREIKTIISSITSTEFNFGTSCYYIYLNLKRDTNGTEAQEDLDKIMDEFQDKLYILQDFLYCIKLDIKNIFLELRNEHDQKHYCEFDASVSRLIQLLTGTNIYCHEYSFVRELIQNSIDAVSFKENLDSVTTPNSKEDADAPISIKLGCDENGHYFQIRDYGIGMKREIIERYFATLGRSYYKEYTERRNINYNSVSNFGIGFLSVFKPCRKIIINTRHFGESTRYTIEINSNRGHYTISPNPESQEFSPGTEITCYFENSNVNFTELIDYIEKIMLDIKYDIKVTDAKKNNETTIKARKIRNEYNNIIFIPFDEDKKTIPELDTSKNWNSILSDAIKTYRHGILISSQQPPNTGIDILSAGILLNNAEFQNVFGQSIKELQHMKVTLNFPPNWLDIDVSREKVNGIRIDYIKGTNNGFQNENNFKIEICRELKRQIWKVFKDNEKLPLIFFKETSMLVTALEQKNEDDSGQNMIELKVHFEKKKIKFYLNHQIGENTSDYLFRKWVFKIKHEDNDENMYKQYQETINYIYKNLSYDEVSAINHMHQEGANFENIQEIFQKLGLDVEDIDKKYWPLIPAILFDKTISQDNIEDKEKLLHLIETAVWEVCPVNPTVKSKILFSVLYDNLEQNKFSTPSDKLKSRVNILVDRYEIKDIICPFDFIWHHIISNALEKCGLSLKENKVNPEKQKEKYECLRNSIKTVYLEDKDSLLDVYTFASCYMSVLMDIPKESLEFPDGTNTDAKYRWIFHVGLGFLYMWILSDEEDKKSENGISGKERSEIIFDLYKRDELDSLFSEEIEKRSIKLLAAHEKMTFDVLCFAELLRWLDDYVNEEILVQCNNDK